MSYRFIVINKRKKFYWVDWGLAIAGVLLFILGNFIPAILLFIMAVLGYIMRKDLNFIFSEKDILLTSFIKKKFEWNEFNNVLLKDGILTLDFKNNKLIQENVLFNENDFSENVFNKFSETKIAES